MIVMNNSNSAGMAIKVEEEDVVVALEDDPIIIVGEEEKVEEEVDVVVAPEDEEEKVEVDMEDDHRDLQEGDTIPTLEEEVVVVEWEAAAVVEDTEVAVTMVRYWNCAIP